jgi:FKBP-type peptidyl-prolyl cis-trans isomerase
MDPDLRRGDENEIMNKTISLIIFIIIAAAIIFTGAWYANKISQDNEQAQVAQGNAAAQAAQQQAEQQQQTMNNLKITDVTVGTGAEAKAGDTVSVLYTGSLDDGTVFDASSKHGNAPFSFVLGAGNVIQGWDLGVAGMKVGGKRELVIPPELGYGVQGMGSIPPNATLHFTVELLKVGQSASSQ